MAKPFLHCYHRFKNGKDHCYWSVAEKARPARDSQKVQLVRTDAGLAVGLAQMKNVHSAEPPYFENARKNHETCQA
jgi:hypothetical protein